MRADISSDHAEAAERRAAIGRGRVIAVVGPSGVGKDSVMAGLLRHHSGLTVVRRAITRPPNFGGEDHESVSVKTFRDLDRAGSFVLSWQAHGLSYGISVDALTPTRTGRDVLVNLSRRVLDAAARRFFPFEILHLHADPRILAGRLSERGRETPGDIADRLAREAYPLPEGLCVHRIDNSGALAQAVDAASRALYPRS